MIKRIVSFLLICVLLVFAAAPTAFSSAETDRIIAQINATFEKAKQLKASRTLNFARNTLSFSSTLSVSPRRTKRISAATERRCTIS